jgi:hypothetical protein
MTRLFALTSLFYFFTGLRGVNSFHRAVRAGRFRAGGWPAHLSPAEACHA